MPNFQGCSGNRLKAQESEDKTAISLTELPQNNRQAGNMRDRYGETEAEINLVK